MVVAGSTLDIRGTKQKGYTSVPMVVGAKSTNSGKGLAAAIDPKALKPKP